MIIVPARLHSSRLKEKLLLEIGGLPIVIRVANIAKSVDSTIVACDDEKILNLCKKHKIEALLTKSTHESGTDRCAEVVEELKLDSNEVVINLQADEPFIESRIIQNLKNKMKENIESTFMTSCYKIINSKEANDPNIVKVVLDKESYALYFSRSKIPYDASNINIKYYAHIGIYAFSAKSIREFCTLNSTLEHMEKLEQLRALYHGKKILMLKVKSDSIGIDTLQDYNKALQRYKGNA